MCGWFFTTQYNCSLPSFVPNFKILGQVVPKKSLTEISIFIILEWEIEKGKKEKEGKNKSQRLVFFFSNTFGCPHCVYKI